MLIREMTHCRVAKLCQKFWKIAKSNPIKGLHSKILKGNLYRIKKSNEDLKLYPYKRKKS